MRCREEVDVEQGERGCGKMGRMRGGDGGRSEACVFVRVQIWGEIVFDLGGGISRRFFG